MGPLVALHCAFELLWVGHLHGEDMSAVGANVGNNS